MYSVVLMMALTGGAESTEFGKKSCCGCTGAPAPVYGCTGRVHHHHRCTGAVSTGCSGGGLFSKLHKRCHGGSGCTGYVAAPVCCGTVAPTAPPMMAPPPPPKKMPTEARSIAPATIIVMVPENARLTVDGNATSSTSARRVLVTPALEVGSDYVYNLTAQIVRDGQTVTESQTITVRGGRTNEVSFDFATSVASR